MTKGRAITVMTASVGDNTVNAYTSMTLSVTPSVPLKNGDVMYFTIPSAITLPSKSSLSCTGSGALQSSIGCNINGQILIVTVALKSSPSTADSSVLTVTFKSIFNPKNTKPTDPVMLNIKNAAGYEIGTSSAISTAIVKVGVPATITTASITPLDYRQ